MHCSLTGELCREPVVSTKTGHIFERSVIEKRLSAVGKCPITNQELSTADLIAVKASNEPYITLAGASGVSSSLRNLQNEWDNMMVECFELRKQNDQLRRQLSDSLYSRDAACRVIARLTRERDSARRALAELSALRELANEQQSFHTLAGPTTTITTTETTAMDASELTIQSSESKESEDVEMNEIQNSSEDKMSEMKDDCSLIEISAISDDSYSRIIENCEKKLSNARRNRGKVAKLTSEECKRWIKSKQAMTGQTATCMDAFSSSLSSSSSSQTMIAAIGCKDASILITDLSNGSVKSVLRGHSSAVRSVCFLGERKTRLVSVTSEGELVHWRMDTQNIDNDGEWIEQGMMDDIPGANLFAVRSHPNLGLCLAATRTGWSLMNVDRADVPCLMASHQCGLSDVCWHGDGQLLLGSNADLDGMMVWDLRTCEKTALLQAKNKEFGTLSLAVSENGYSCYTGHTSGIVRSWDLRKQDEPSSQYQFDSTTSVSALAADTRGSAFSVTLSDGSTSVLSKKLKMLHSFQEDDGEHSKADLGACFLDSLTIPFVMLGSDGITKYSR